MIVRPKFEDCLPEVNRVINLHLNKWKLNGAIPSISREDIHQELLQHFFLKWHLYNPARPLGNWCTTVCCNFLFNLTRNFFYKFSKPCVALKCAAYLGGDDCKLYVKTCSACPMYAEWEKGKKQQHDVNLPLSLENDNRMTKLSETPFDDSNILEKVEELKYKLEDKLTKNEFHIFNALYLENKTEAEVQKELKFPSKAEGNRQIKAVRNSIYQIVKNILVEEEMF